jgi:hypothetical protein
MKNGGENDKNHCQLELNMPKKYLAIETKILIF